MTVFVNCNTILILLCKTLSSTNHGSVCMENNTNNVNIFQQMKVKSLWMWESELYFLLEGIGASHYVMNCNVTIDTQEVSLGRDVATAIRESSPGGIPGVQVIALPHEGMVEIACNVESVHSSATGGESWPAFIVGDQTFCHAPASLITTRVAELARSRGVRTRGTALVGFTPLECKKLAETALSQDIGHFWKELHRVHM